MDDNLTICTIAASRFAKSRSASPLSLASLLAAGPPLFGQMNHRRPPNLPPEIHSSFADDDYDYFAPVSYRAPPALLTEHSNFGMLTTSIPSPAHKMVLPSTHNQAKPAVEYARRCGLRIALDLEISLARVAFPARHPGQQQWMLRLGSFPLPPEAPRGYRIDHSARLPFANSNRVLGTEQP
jgi:hypothetical protein